MAIRLFVALDLPEEITQTIESLRDPDLRVRWTPVEQLHLTLSFLGDVEADRVSQVEQALSGVHANAVLVQFERLTTFPSHRKPRVLVVKMGETETLMSLQGRIERALARLGLAQERRRFSPHVTFGRVKGAGPREVRRHLAAKKPFSLPDFETSEFHLYASVLKPTGALHERLETFPLDERSV